MLKEHISGEKTDKPISQAPGFIFLFSLYTSLLLWLTLRFPGEFPIVRFLGVPSGFEIDYISFAPGLLFVSSGLWLRFLSSHDAVFDWGVTGLKFRSLSVSVLYVAMFTIALFQLPFVELSTGTVDSQSVCQLASSTDCQQYIPVLWAYTFAQAILVGLIYEVYSHPITPQKTDDTEWLAHHHDNWWKLAQVLFTGITIIIAIMALSPREVAYTNMKGELLPILGLISIFYYVLWKRTQVYPTGEDESSGSS